MESEGFKRNVNFFYRFIDAEKPYPLYVVPNPPDRGPRRRITQPNKKDSHLNCNLFTMMESYIETPYL